MWGGGGFNPYGQPDCKKTVLFLTTSLYNIFFLWRYFIRRHIFRGFEEIILRLCQHPQKLVTKNYKNQGNFGSNYPCPKNRHFLPFIWQKVRMSYFFLPRSTYKKQGSLDWEGFRKPSFILFSLFNKICCLS